MAGDPQNCDSKTWMYSRTVHRSDPPIGLSRVSCPTLQWGWQGTYCKKIVGVMPDGPWPKTMVPAVCLGFVDQVEDPQESLIHQGINRAAIAFH